MKLPFSVTRVVKASQLGDEEKLVWLEHFIFDRGEAGAYISAASVAIRLGKSARTIERLRRELKGKGLLRTESRGPGLTASWFCVLPAECIPSRVPKDDDVSRLAARLNAHLTRTPDAYDGGTTDTDTAPAGGTPVIRDAENTTHDGGPPSHVSEVLAQFREQPCTSLHPPLQLQDGELKSSNLENGAGATAPDDAGEQQASRGGEPEAIGNVIEQRWRVWREAQRKVAP